MNFNQYFEAIEHTANAFEAITLQEMDSVKLMDRVDVKYLIPLALFPQILSEAQANYRLLEVEGKRICPYETLYYDTPNLDLYTAHQTGKLNRYKVRARNYVDSNLKFFEIKFKNNKGRTIKTRIERPEISTSIDADSVNFLMNTTHLSPTTIGGVLWVNYARMTLVNRVSPERLTLDLKLTFKNDTDLKSYPEIVIAEVKQEKMRGSVFIDLMKKYHIRAGAISKYCFGMISLNDDLKQNNFKKHLRSVSKIIHQYDAITTNHVA